MERFGEKAHKKIAELIKTRTAAQVRTYIAKQRKAVAKPRAPAPAGSGAGAGVSTARAAAARRRAARARDADARWVRRAG